MWQKSKRLFVARGFGHPIYQGAHLRGACGSGLKADKLLQMAAKGLKFAHLPVDLLNLFTCQFAHALAWHFAADGEIQQLPDVVELHAEGLRPPDETQPGRCVALINPVAVGTALRSGDDAMPFIVAHRRRLEAARAT